MTSTEWVQGGYYPISTRETPWRDNKILPPHADTVSDCIVDRFPDVSWLLDERVNETTVGQIQDTLGLNGDELPGLFEWIDRAWDTGSFGWPGVFLSLSAAREFQDRFLHTVETAVRLVGLSLDSALVPEYCTASDVLTQLLRHVPLEPGGVLLGFDIAVETGEICPTFHTFSCHGLERDFSKIAGVSFNEHGLIATYSDAVAAWEFMGQLEVDEEPEPADWLPFRVDEYAQPAAG